jgi:hypothetical protein
MRLPDSSRNRIGCFPVGAMDNRLVMQLEDVTASTARLSLGKPDTDHQVSYCFTMDDCWRLVRIENQSL